MDEVLGMIDKLIPVCCFLYASGTGARVSPDDIDGLLCLSIWCYVIYFWWNH